MVDEHYDPLDNDAIVLEEEPDEEGTSVYEHHRLKADQGQKPMRIDKFLMEHLCNTSRNRTSSL